MPACAKGPARMIRRSAGPRPNDLPLSTEPPNLPLVAQVPRDTTTVEIRRNYYQLSGVIHVGPPADPLTTPS
eukprot:1176480-Prorocentrum_minimum.AAC.3